jgi:YfiH family protein
VSGLTCLRASALDGVPHAFLGRTGGVSQGLFDSLNTGLGSGDDPAAVAENRRRAAGALGRPDALATARQVHSARAIIVPRPLAGHERPQADALITHVPGLALGVLTADCAPVLLADPAARIVAAAHAGWRGAVAGIIEATVATMEELGAERHRILAAIGPTIAQASYEVGAEFDARVPARFLAPGAAPDRRHFDLEGYVADRLAAAGVGQVERLATDTYANPERFFSFRRATHAGEADYGRQIALIMLR